MRTQIQLCQSSKRETTNDRRTVRRSDKQGREKNERGENRRERSASVERRRSRRREKGGRGPGFTTALKDGQGGGRGGDAAGLSLFTRWVSRVRNLVRNHVLIELIMLRVSQVGVDRNENAKRKWCFLFIYFILILAFQIRLINFED